MTGLLTPLPRHSCRGLIEAATCGSHGSNPARLFPGIRAGASLKRQQVVEDPGRIVLFPGIRAGALLKRLARPLRLRPHAELFPGIRAGALLKRANTATGNAILTALFPGIRAGALLKQCKTVSLNGMDPPSLPRHSCRGLIEANAQEDYFCRIPSPLPRHSCRGLIEASNARRMDLIVAVLFPGIRAGALLKRTRPARPPFLPPARSSPAFVPGPY